MKWFYHDPNLFKSNLKCTKTLSPTVIISFYCTQVRCTVYQIEFIIVRSMCQPTFYIYVSINSSGKSFHKVEECVYGNFWPFFWKCVRSIGPYSQFQFNSSSLRSGLCAGQSSPSTPNLPLYVLKELSFLWLFPQSWAMLLSKMSWNAEVLCVPFPGIKVPNPIPGRQLHTIIPSVPTLLLTQSSQESPVLASDESILIRWIVK